MMRIPNNKINGLLPSNRPLSLLEAVNFSGQVLRISTPMGSVIARRCVVGDPKIGLFYYDSFPTDRMDAMVLNWRGPICTFTTDPNDPDPNAHLRFTVDAVYIRPECGRVFVTDAIEHIRPRTGITRQPSIDSELVVLFKGGDVQAKDIMVGEPWNIRLVK